MANNFTADANCVALWKLDNGAMLRDELHPAAGGTTLVSHGAPTQIVGGITQEGTGCVNLNRNTNDYFTVVDALLPADFPMKSGTANAVFSVCTWFYTDIAPDASHRAIFSKHNTVVDKRCFLISLVDAANAYIRLNFGHTGGTASQAINIYTGIVSGQWYHLGVTVSAVGAGGAWTGLLWDPIAGGGTETALAGAAITNALNIENADLQIGIYAGATGQFDGNLDEIVVFKDILLEAEIRAIRQGTFPSGSENIYADKWHPEIQQPYVPRYEIVSY